ncbi:MAG TPA: arylamine N-acetyltransferase [Candidatus Limnocylindrales bacterium]|nr:arylamine N-acetyltransferase [Candidatus Limnocylindrales bacterium]
MDVDAYLTRIGLARPAAPTAQALADLQVAHLLTVPFENLDIVAGVPITLAVDALFDKIVRRLRGGFCYELNGLFAVLLESLDYRVTRLSARTIDGDDGAEGPEFDHLVLRVDLDEPWLADVGFGDSFRTPIPLRPNDVHVDLLGRSYQLVVNGNDWDLQERPTPDADWTTSFRFSLVPRNLADFEDTCRWQQSDSPHFTQHRFCSIATVDGRRTIMDDRFITTSRGERTERMLEESEVAELLDELFGIVHWTT